MINDVTGISFGSYSEDRKETLDQMADKMITGKAANELLPDEFLFPYIGDRLDELTIIDFGCGIGRNLYHLAEFSPCWNVIGYDQPRMIEYTGEYFELKFRQPRNKIRDIFPNLSTETNWSILRCKKVDVIFSTLVFQHLSEKDLFGYVEDIKNMAKRLIVAGRRWNDEKGNSTWGLLEKCGLYPDKCNSPEFYNAEGPRDDHFCCVYYL